MKREIRQTSRSKVNLWLKVTGKRSDGYHELETLFLPLNAPADEISITISEGCGITIASSDPTLPCDSRNICWKAARVFFEASGIEKSVDIHIRKTIPVAAGLGGGSGNAATVLSILNGLFNTLEEDELTAVALKIGADVPFFLKSQPATAEGVGEKLVYLDLDCSSIPLLIAAPDFPVSAAWAYQNLAPGRIGRKKGMKNLLRAIKAQKWDQCATYLHNDLGFALFEKFPVLEIIRKELLNTGAFQAEISGSGPSLFAIYPNPTARAEAADRIRKSFQGKVRVFMP